MEAEEQLTALSELGCMRQREHVEALPNMLSMTESEKCLGSSAVACRYGVSETFFPFNDSEGGVNLQMLHGHDEDVKEECA